MSLQTELRVLSPAASPPLAPHSSEEDEGKNFSDLLFFLSPPITISSSFSSNAGFFCPNPEMEEAELLPAVAAKKRPSSLLFPTWLIKR